MGISIKSRKMLWGRSGNCCAFPECRKELVMEVEDSNNVSIIGEEAHIVAKGKKGARGNGVLTSAERDQYENLILLCRLHHKIIDDNPSLYPIQKLHVLKNEHEQWVRGNLTFDQAKQKDEETYSEYLDKLLEYLSIPQYTKWTETLLDGDPKLPQSIHSNLEQAASYLLSRIWKYRYPALEGAFENVRFVVNDFLYIFNYYSLPNHNETVYYTEKFYRIRSWNEELYDRLLEKYKFHIKFVEDLILELTRSLNYLFEQVRVHLYPTFRIREGALIVNAGPFPDQDWDKVRVEYRPEEITNGLYPGWKAFLEIRHTRDRYIGEGIENIYL